MAEVEELLDDVTVRMPSAAEVRARGDRRRVRLRAGTGAVAVAMVAGMSWALLPGGGGPQEVRPAGPPAATSVAEPNPYKTGNEFNGLADSDVPLFTKWHWRLSDEPGKEAVRLPRLGFDDACPQTPDTSQDRLDQVSYTALYEGDGKSIARHRYVDYANAAQAADGLRQLTDALAACGLEPRGKGADMYYAGDSAGGPWLRVDVDHGRAWISVIEVQAAKE
ncbi:hypothetical protein ACFWDI_17995 [Streptomyces sp. NPDC060064]|uniref:hypothetical protein n=1 Tax=Streptomyces sp. NPDC060064 TaxID=3347049 RepID=UPI0036B97C37